MMLARARRLLARLRAVPAPRPPAEPPRRWRDELADAALSVDAWLERRQSTGRLYVSISDESVAQLVQRQPALVRATLDAAARILDHQFDLLGSGPYVPADPDRSALEDGYRPLDWFLDPVSRLRFPRGVPHQDWNLERMRPGRADIKLPWELSRCQHWPLLGEAYRITGDARYAVEIANELRDFMDANPVGIGVNWTCTMDVAIRAANWALGLELVRTCPRLPPDFWAFAYEALFAHGAFIERNLENKYEVTSNHFLSNVVGLFYLAAVFQDLPRGVAWDGQCRAWLDAEMAVQVLPDGADYESSVPYHRLVTELFLGAARVADYAGEPLPPFMLERLRGMIDFMSSVLRPDGLMPQVGDADDGRLHVLSGYGVRPARDPRHLFVPAACLLGNAEWTALGDEWGAWEAAWWGFEPPTLSKPPALMPDVVRQFEHAGITVARHRAHYLLITNGVVGTAGFGNHKHNDLLGFEYHAAGVPILVDAGSYVYTSDPDSRNQFRGTGLHNTVMIDGTEQNEIRPEWLFRMFATARPEHVAFIERSDEVAYIGRHHGYARLPEPVVHERAFTFQQSTGALAIRDTFHGTGSHRLRWHFHFAPEVEVLPRGDGEVEIRARDATLTMRVPTGLHPVGTPAWYSPAYGVRVRCAALDLDTVHDVAAGREFLFQFMVTS